MADIILKKVGNDKNAVIKVLCDATGLGLKEAVDIVDDVILEEKEYIINNIPKENVNSIINDFAVQGALAVEKIDMSDDFSTTESEDTTDVNVKNYNPIVSLDMISTLDRQKTMEVLIEVRKIAEESEEYNREIVELKKRINEEQGNVKEIREHITGKAKVIIAIVTILSMIIGLAGTIIASIIVGVLVYLFVGGIIAAIDQTKHEDINNANADAYIQEHIAPLQTRLDELYALREQMTQSGKLTWAIDIVGKDLFYSACISDIYNLIKNRRADSLKEALNKYDDEQYKARMEEMQQAIQNASDVAAVEAAKQTAYSKEIAKSSHETATAAKATAYHTRQTAHNTKKISKNTKNL